MRHVATVVMDIQFYHHAERSAVPPQRNRCIRSRTRSGRFDRIPIDPPPSCQSAHGLLLLNACPFWSIAADPLQGQPFSI
jgi:hypothetical protein